MGRGKGQRSQAGTRTSTRRGRRRRQGRQASWRPRELQRSYRSLLDMAKEEPQTIEDTDGEVLVLQSSDRASFEHELVERIAELGQFQAAYGANRGKPVGGWAAQTPFPWIVSLSDEEVAEFARELVAYTFDAAQRETLENLDGNLRAWRSTASIYEDPELLDSLTASFDPDDLDEVFPPSEKQVREAEGA